MVETIIDFFMQSASETRGQSPQGFCPNCWGEQEYDSMIREMYEDKQIDVNNNQANYAFIQEFVVNRIEGIHLKKGDNSMECPTCKVKYPK